MKKKKMDSKKKKKMYSKKKKKMYSKKKKMNLKKKKMDLEKKKMNPNWLELPEDVWFAILSKLKTIDVMENAQKVCMLFRKLCKHPSMFMKIDMYLPVATNCSAYVANLITQIAVDRSACQLVDIYLGYLCDDETLLYMAQRSPNLRHLRLGHCACVSDEGLTEAVQKLPILEELQLIICTFSEMAVKAVGHALPTLRSFSLTQVSSNNNSRIGFNEEVLAISTSMPDLRHLQLIGSNMTNEGLKAILDGCPLLESLDLRACFHIDLSGDLGKRCKSIKHLRLPHDSTQDHGQQAYIKQEAFGYDSVSGYVDFEDEYSDDDLGDGYSDNHLDDDYSDDDLEDENSDDDIEDENSDDDLEDGDSDNDLEDECSISNDEVSDDSLEDEDSNDEVSDGGLEDEDSNDEDSDDGREDGDSDDDLESEYSDDEDSDD